MNGHLILWRSAFGQRRHRDVQSPLDLSSVWKLERQDVMFGPVPDFETLGIR
jgi:hypothetical protein